MRKRVGRICERGRFKPTVKSGGVVDGESGEPAEEEDVTNVQK